MAPRLRHLAGAAVALALSSGLLGACGGSSSSGNGIASKSPKEIVAETRAAAEKASSVHVSGSIASASAPIALNLDLAAGRGGHGQLSEGGVGFEVIQASGIWANDRTHGVQFRASFLKASAARPPRSFCRAGG